MIRLNHVIYFLLLFLTGTVSCKRTDSDGILGPDLKAASNGFAVTESFKVFGKDNSGFEADEANLTEPETTLVEIINPETGIAEPSEVITTKPRSIFFKAKFNEKVRWRIEIQPSNTANQKTTAPFKTISGTSDYIDSIPEWTWNGSSDNQYFFVPGRIDFRLIILGLNDTTTVSKNLLSGITYSETTAFLLNDFEGKIPITPYGDKNDRIPYPDPYIVDNIPLTPQGSKSLLLIGTDYNGDYFVAGNQQKFSKGTLAGRKASDIYINVFIYGFPSNAGLTQNATKVSIGVSQDNYNDNGEFDPATEDTFEQQLSVDWVGWKLISVKYSNMKRSSSANDGGNGPNKIQPETAVQIGTNLLSSPNGSSVGAAVDYAIVTFGKPLDK